MKRDTLGLEPVSIMGLGRRLFRLQGDVRYRWHDRWAVIYSVYIAKYIFIHINKTGGSSVEAALGLPFQHRTASELRKAMGLKRWASRFSFAFVRNPWDRVVSHYHYRVRTNQTGLKDRPIPFGEWVRRAYGEMDPRWYDQPKMFMPQIQWICDEKGSLIVDFVGRFERIEDDFSHICQNIEEHNCMLPHYKSSNHKQYITLYDNETYDIIANHFRQDISIFNYTFGA